MVKCSWCNKEIVEGKRRTIHESCSKLKWLSNNKEKVKDYYKNNKEEILNKNKLYNNKNKEVIKEYWKNWKSKNRNSIKKTKSKYYKENKEKYKEYSENQRKKNPELINARNKSRVIKLKNHCEICGSKNNLQKHHWNYDKPLLVNTLCGDCHRIQHIKNFRDSIFGRKTC
ncbi:MAG: hypothetical protein M0R17_06095 [Candidatus Omnitrophica bacterium]|jgi:hypothetical protein|nr:hypothetical protein [Candidatus Omnitrophota bacterium]